MVVAPLRMSASAPHGVVVTTESCSLFLLHVIFIDGHSVRHVDTRATSSRLSKRGYARLRLQETSETFLKVGRTNAVFFAQSKLLRILCIQSINTGNQWRTLDLSDSRRGSLAIQREVYHMMYIIIVIVFVSILMYILDENVVHVYAKSKMANPSKKRPGEIEARSSR